MNLSEKTCSFINNYPDIIKNSDYIKLRDIPRHGYTNTFDHSMRVARLSYLIAERFGADKESAVKTALLHDFCLIDYRAEDYKKPEGESCYLIKHSKDAVINSREYKLTPKEERAILTHMFPLGPMPTSKTGWILTIADKIAAAYECCGGFILNMASLYFGKSAA